MSRHFSIADKILYIFHWISMIPIDLIDSVLIRIWIIVSILDISWLSECDYPNRCQNFEIDENIVLQIRYNQMMTRMWTKCVLVESKIAIVWYKFIYAACIYIYFILSSPTSRFCCLYGIRFLSKITSTPKCSWVILSRNSIFRSIRYSLNDSFVFCTSWWACIFLYPLIDSHKMTAMNHRSWSSLVIKLIRYYPSERVLDYVTSTNYLKKCVSSEKIVQFQVYDTH